MGDRLTLPSYQTADMEAAINRLAQAYRHVIVFHQYLCQPRIFFRMNRVEHPCYLYREWDSEGRKELARWQKSGGVLILYFYRHSSPVPPCDALVFIECPLQMEHYLNHTECVRHEAVVFRPPSWRLHEDAVTKRFPHEHRNVVTALRALHEQPVNERRGFCIEHHDKPGKQLVCFEMQAVVEITGLSIKSVLSAWRALVKVNPNSMRYRCVTPVLEIEDDTYAAIEGYPAGPKGERFVPFISLNESRLKRLVKEGYVRRKPDLFVIELHAWRPNFRILDAIAEARAEDWIRLRDFVDRCPEIQSEPPGST